MADNLQGQMVSGRYVGASPLQGIANMYSAYTGKQLAREADRKQQELAEMLRQQSIKDLQAYGEAVTPRAAIEARPEVIPQGQTMLDDQGVPTMGYQAPVQAMPEKKADYNKGLGILLGSRSPQSQALGQALLADQLKTIVAPEGSTIYRGSIGGTGETIRGATKLPPEVTAATVFLGLDKKPREQWTQQDLMNIERKANEFKRSGASSTVINTEKSYGQAFGQNLAGNDVKLYDSASRAPQMLDTVKETRKLLDNDKLYVGFGANQKLDLARAADAFGITGKDTAEKIANTQRLFANRAQATLDSVKESGLGAGNGFTDKDREFLEKSKLGNIVYSRDALKQQLDIEERVARGLAQKWNTRFDQIPESAKGPTGVTKIELAAPVTAGSKTAPNVGDVQNGWRFKGGNPAVPTSWERVK
jgi:hypothetical protein